MLDLIRNKLVNHALKLSQFLIKVARESVMEEDRLDGAEDVLNIAVEIIISHFVAGGSFHPPSRKGNEDRTWTHLNNQLMKKGFSEDFVKQHREYILAYVRALRQHVAVAGKSVAQNAYNLATSTDTSLEEHAGLAESPPKADEVDNLRTRSTNEEWGTYPGENGNESKAPEHYEVDNDDISLARKDNATPSTTLPLRGTDLEGRETCQTDGA
ncbi:MAG: hypothetical protein Q9218_007342 [Villophora microphyllina]